MPLLRLLGQAQLIAGNEREGLRTLDLALAEARELGWPGEITRINTVIAGNTEDTDSTQLSASWHQKA
jgi:hypothetical protein